MHRNPPKNQFIPCTNYLNSTKEKTYLTIMRSVPRNFRPKRRKKRQSKPMNPKSVIAVTCMGLCGCFILFILWYYYPYHSLQFFIEHTDIDQAHYTEKLKNMGIHPKYAKWTRRHNKNNESMHNNVSSINNDYNANTDTVSIQIGHAPDTERMRHTFLKYLEPICIHKTVLSHEYLNSALPEDCSNLLDAMMNISIRHLLNENEVNALAQRMEYLVEVVPQNGIYLVIHIPHTAMSSIVEQVILTQFEQASIAHFDGEMVGGMSEQTKVIYGHFPFGFDKQLNAKTDGDDNLWMNKLNFTYYAMLRDPFDFVVANYFDAKNKENYKDLYDFVEHKSNRNVMTKYFCNCGEEMMINGNEYMKARNNLMSLGWIGIFDDLQQSVDKLMFFWNLDGKIKIAMETNKNFDKPFDVKLSVSEHQTILKRNKWDAMLYEQASVLKAQQEIIIKYTKMSK